MGFPCEHELQWTLRIREQAREPVVIADDQVGALVRREAAREADRERLRIERLTEAARAHDAQQLPLRSAVHTPEGVPVELVRACKVGCAEILFVAEQR